MYNFQVGQEIIVVDSRRSYIQKGKIVKKGKKFYHVEYEGFTRLDKIEIGEHYIYREGYTSTEAVYPSIEEYERVKTRYKRTSKIKEVLYRVSLSNLSDEDLSTLERIFKIEQEA